MHNIHQAPDGALVVFPSLSRRQRMARRRVFAVAAVAALAVAGFVFGALTQPRSGAAERTGALSYLSE
jgi:uncharacterized protein involved in exopolysaccharide biosynthesis